VPAAAGGHAVLYPFEVIIVWDGLPLFSTLTLAQYGCGKKVTVKVVVAAVIIVVFTGATSTPLHTIPEDGVTE